MRPVKRARVDGFVEMDPICVKIFSYIASTAQLSLRSVSQVWKASVDGYLTMLGRDIAKVEEVEEFSQTAVAIWTGLTEDVNVAFRVAYFANKMKNLVHLLDVALNLGALRGLYDNILSNSSLHKFYRKAQFVKAFPGRIPDLEASMAQTLVHRLLAPEGRIHRIGYLYQRGIFYNTLLPFFRTFHFDYVLPAKLYQVVRLYQEEVLALSSVAFAEQYKGILPSLALIPTAHLRAAPLEDLKKGADEILRAVKKSKQIYINNFRPSSGIYSLPEQIVRKISVKNVSISRDISPLPLKGAVSIFAQGFLNPSIVSNQVKKLKITKPWRQDWAFLKKTKIIDLTFQDTIIAPSISVLPICLVKLNLKRADLNEFPDVRPLKKLEELSLEYNQITSFPDWIEKLKLKRLDMSSNSGLEIASRIAIKLRVLSLNLRACTQIEDNGVFMLLHNRFIGQVELEGYKYIHLVLKILKANPGITKQVVMNSGHVPLEALCYEALPANVLYH